MLYVMVIQMSKSVTNKWHLSQGGHMIIYNTEKVIKSSEIDKII